MFVKIQIFVKINTKLFICSIFLIRVVKILYTRSSLKILDTSSVFPISLLLKTTFSMFASIFLPFVRNILYFVFAMFTAILLLLNQFANFLSSLFTKVISSGRFLFSARHDVSSANKNVANLVAEKISYCAESIFLKLALEKVNKNCGLWFV